MSVTGSPAGFGATAFINPTIWDGYLRLPTSSIIDPGFPYHIFKLVRNPPHVFGTGYAIKVAEEMTFQLLQLKLQALIKAATGGQEQHQPLRLNQFRAKLVPPASADAPLPNPTDFDTIDFGTYIVRYQGKPVSEIDAATIAHDFIRNQTFPPLSKPGSPASAPSPAPGAQFVEDYSQIVGVSRDLVVRPLQWKGIASNERNFVNDALDFHFGMLSVEKSFHLQPKATTLAQYDPDLDRDGVPDELSVGNVTALTIFTMSIRPPTRITPTQPEANARVQKGIRLFLFGPPAGAGSGSTVSTAAPGPGVGGAASAPPPQATACATCHAPAMRIYSNSVSADNPRTTVVSNSKAAVPGANAVVAESAPAGARIAGHISPVNSTGLSSQRLHSSDLPAVQRFLRAVQSAPVAPGAPMHLDPLDLPQNSADLVRFNLTTLQQEAPINSTLPYTQPAASIPFAHTQPRLPENPPLPGRTGASIDVPLFSDLKRHKMGAGLADKFEQGTDVQNINVPVEEFLTRPLWGVADGAPFLHDGRALSLKDAILQHGSEGSEAHDLVAHLAAHPDELDSIVAFLQTLRLPHNPRYAFDRNPQQTIHEEETNHPLPFTQPPLKLPPPLPPAP